MGGVNNKTIIMESTIKLTEEKFNEIYICEKFRNQVANAYGHYDSKSNFKYKATCSYPVKYIVTEDQIKTASKLKETAKKEVLNTHKNSLLLVGMGMVYDSRYEGDVCNYRVRTRFKSPSGKIFFIEFGTGRDPEQMRVDHSILIENEEKHNNYLRLERRGYYPKYTLDNILKFVNDNFECNFKNVIVDNYNISCEGIICESPS